jgi:glycerophosphoryl diester phosphodiesterase
VAGTVPRVPHPFLDHPGPIAFAHRGGAGDHPENTMPAFEAAIALGYRYVETDVHVTADGVLVAFHDASLDRVTDRHGLIREQTWSEVSRARVAGRAPIPCLDELLGAWPDVRVNIDPKHDSATGPLARALPRLGALDRVCVTAFSDARLRRLRSAVGPGLCTGMGPQAIARLRAVGFGVPFRPAGDCVQVPVRAGRVTIVDRRFVETAHRLGLPVHVWTVDDAPTMRGLLDLGVDGIMTDRPTVLKDVLERRHQWVGRH